VVYWPRVEVEVVPRLAEIFRRRFVLPSVETGWDTVIGRPRQCQAALAIRIISSAD